MGVAYYPVFEKAIPGFNPSVEVSGKSMAKALEVLDGICRKLEKRELSSFYSESNHETFASIGSDAPPGLCDEPIAWSQPADGLTTVDALLEHLSREPSAVERPEAVIADLRSLRRVLLEAERHHTRFRLRIDA